MAGMIVRLITVYGSTAVWQTPSHPVPRAWRPVLVWGGLRGGVAIALALGLSPALPDRDAIVAGTFGIVIFTSLVQGLTMRPLLRWTGLLPAAGRARPTEPAAPPR